MHRNNVQPNCTIRFKNERKVRPVHSSFESGSLESKFPRFIRIPQNSQRSLEILGRQWTPDVNKWLTQLGLFSDARAAAAARPHAWRPAPGLNLIHLKWASAGRQLRPLIFYEINYNDSSNYHLYIFQRGAEIRIIPAPKLHSSPLITFFFNITWMGTIYIKAATHSWW